MHLVIRAEFANPLHERKSFGSANLAILKPRDESVLRHVLDELYALAGHRLPPCRLQMAAQLNQIESPFAARSAVSLPLESGVRARANQLISELDGPFVGADR